MRSDEPGRLVAALHPDGRVRLTPMNADTAASLRHSVPSDGTEADWVLRDTQEEAHDAPQGGRT